MKLQAEERKGKYFVVLYGTEHEIVIPEKKKKSTKKSSKKK